MTDPNATAALEETNPSENEGAADQSSENSFFIPKDVVASTGYKDGDKTITLNVMGADEDGDLEVCGPNASEGGDWRDELKTELTKAGTDSSNQGNIQ